MKTFFAFFISFVALISSNVRAAPPEVDLERATRCLVAGDLAEVMYVDLQKSNQLDSEPLDQWKARFAQLGMPAKYLAYAHMRFFNARPTNPVSLAQDTAAYCVSNELPELKDNLPRSCYAISKSLNAFFQARRRGRTKEETLVFLDSPAMKKNTKSEDGQRLIHAARFAFSVPMEMENTPYGRPGYFAACLATSGDIYGKPSTNGR